MPLPDRKETEIDLLPKANGSLGELHERESRIERCQRNAYYEIGLELAAIRDRGLYKAHREAPVAGRYSFTTFEEYCEQRWEIAYRTAKQLIEAAQVAEKLRNCADFLPARESHVRALLALDKDEDRAAVWQRMIGAKEITAKTIEAEVVKYKAEQEKNWITLEEWEKLSAPERAALVIARPDHHSTFNDQDNDNIEWAR